MAAHASTTPAVTKRFTLSISGDGGTGTFNGSTDYSQRLRVAMAVTPFRFRFRLRNSRIIPATAQTGALSFTGINIGTPSYPTGGIWADAATATQTQLVAPFVTDAAGADYTTDWTSDLGTYFTPGLERLVSMGFTTTGTGINIANGTLGGRSYWGAGASAAAGSATPVGSAASNTFLDVRMDVEYLDSANRPTVLVVGDSIPAGYEGQPEGSGVAPHETWVGRACMRAGIPWVNISVSGSSVGNWTTPGTWAWTRCDLVTTVPDIAIIALGYNDFIAATTLTTFKAGIGTIVSNLRALGIKRIYVSTVIPGSEADPTLEALRQSYNTWLASLPWGTLGCFDVAKMIELQASSKDPDPDYVTTPPHPQKRGYERMSLAVKF